MILMSVLQGFTKINLFKKSNNTNKRKKSPGKEEKPCKCQLPFRKKSSEELKHTKYTRCTHKKIIKIAHS